MWITQIKAEAPRLKWIPALAPSARFKSAVSPSVSRPCPSSGWTSRRRRERSWDRISPRTLKALWPMEVRHTHTYWNTHPVVSATRWNIGVEMPSHPGRLHVAHRLCHFACARVTLRHGDETLWPFRDRRNTNQTDGQLHILFLCIFALSFCIDICHKFLFSIAWKIERTLEPSSPTLPLRRGMLKSWHKVF